ncbi:SPOR domain-containing protein [Xylophilus ampelinus]|uniref:DedD protein n=1 Tax=Xylophilus ampelinus TaxID=54067 RepID=A0A318SGP9_9BURK|nr:SPOR domain-containing protein [Xylophilus ampelinus]MCS4510374.1 SPOR domain-containing protein [Xylophilus ampelinus]PYE78003.1 DedD protein [Xylophilus ampelinus]
MAFFKFRWPGRKGQDDTKAPRSRRMPQAESAAVLRRRARHRLIGATVLVALGVIGFPMLFDTQPRPIPVDIQISIPDRNKTPALVLPENRAAAEAAKKQPAPASAAGLDEGEEIVSSAPVNATAGTQPAAKPADTPVVETRKEPPPPKVETPRVAAAPPKREAKPETKPEARHAPAAVARADDAARARALLEGRTVPPAAAVADNSPAAAASDAGSARFVVQVGAFGDTAKAQEARAKLARSGLKTYVQSVDTKEGKRHRVRVGPFANRAEADQAAARIRGLDLPASILAL